MPRLSVATDQDNRHRCTPVHDAGIQAVSVGDRQFGNPSLQHFSPLVSKFGNTSSNKVANPAVTENTFHAGKRIRIGIIDDPVGVTLPSHGRNRKHDSTEVEAKKRSVMPPG